ncbi:tRNA 2-thiouridine(34) synthase MnmA [bacterium D16-76]|nr:tRNA 2-thiouridine(34) synthase MnmA [bacterium D16-76]
MERVLIAMSGGVDSSVSALLVKQAGLDAIGVTLSLQKNCQEELFPGEKTCCSVDDVNDARRVCARLGLPFYVFNFQDDFQAHVIDPFVSAYQNGQTPNPCIDCNKHIKFGKLLRRAQEIGCTAVATGHYARVEQDKATGRYLLKTGLDPQKDQSYMLYSLTQEQLSRVRFPLGSLTKGEVRQLAEENGLINAHKRDSQDICFVPDGDYARFIEEYTHASFPPGDFVSPTGQVYGRHKGIIHYTIGQRKGLGISFPQPMYVTKIDPLSRQVTLAPHEALFARTVTAHTVNLIAAASLPTPVRAQVKLRYRHAPQPATVQQTGPDQLTVVFDEPQRAPTPGQALVAYDGDIVIGGGIIGKEGNP